MTPDEPAITAGKRLERAIRTALVDLTGTTMAELSRQSGVSRQTFYMWFTDRQDPTATSMTRVAHVLGVRVSDLWDAWEGREVMPSSTEEALTALVREMQETNQLQREMIDRFDALARGAMVAGVARALADVGPTGTPPPPPRRRKPAREGPS